MLIRTSNEFVIVLDENLKYKQTVFAMDLINLCMLKNNLFFYCYDRPENVIEYSLLEYDNSV